MNLIELLVSNFPLGIWMEDLNRNIQKINNKFSELLKVEKDISSNSKIEDVLRDEEYSYEILIKNENEMYYKIFKKGRILEGRLIKVKDIGYVGILDLEENNLMKNILDSMEFCISVKDVDGRLIISNKKFDKFLEGSQDALLGYKYLQRKDGNRLVNEIKKREVEALNSKDTKRYEVEYDGKKVMKVAKYRMENSNGEVIGIIGASKDVTERKRIQAEIIEASYTDSLTGIHNRNYFEKLVEELKRKDSKKLVLLMGDADGLKVVNDTLGHLEGDRYIKKIANIFLEAIDGLGDVIRWGGDEFIALIPVEDEAVGKEIQERINELCRKDKSKPIPISISVGYSYRDVSTKTLDDMIEEAETLVYKEKISKSAATKERLLKTLQKSVLEKSMETHLYSEKIICMAKKICEKLNLNDNEIKDVLNAIKLRDIGKVAIPDEILAKNYNALTEEEFETLKDHVEKGYRIVKTDPDLVGIAKVILTHHEYYDGTGYPLGLKGESIPLAARIIRILDCYEYYSVRYDKNLTQEEMLEMIKNEAGSKYDPKIVKIFLDIVGEM